MNIIKTLTFCLVAYAVSNDAALASGDPVSGALQGVSGSFTQWAIAIGGVITAAVGLILAATGRISGQRLVSLILGLAIAGGAVSLVAWAFGLMA